MNRKIPQVYGVELSGIRNRNEIRVAEAMPGVLEADYSDYILDPLDIEDIYALTLNLLPARYVQRGSIVLRKEPPEEEVRETICDAADRVLQNPTRAEKK